MKQVYRECRNKVGDKFYIIGIKGKGALKHEVAHGFFFLDANYKKEMTALVKQMDPALRKSFQQYLMKIGYTPKVYTDETQAYMSTADEFSRIELFTPETVAALVKAQQPFREVFNRYYKAK